jgi:hypothetical protein
MVVRLVSSINRVRLLIYGIHRKFAFMRGFNFPFRFKTLCEKSFPRTFAPHSESSRPWKANDTRKSLTIGRPMGFGGSETAAPCNFGKDRLEAHLIFHQL